MQITQMLQTYQLVHPHIAILLVHGYVCVMSSSRSDGAHASMAFVCLGLNLVFRNLVFIEKSLGLDLKLYGL